MPAGENVLIYGENGSGKSSIYHALKDFFESSENSNLQFWRHYYADDSGDGAVEITFSEIPNTIPEIADEVFDFNTNVAIRTANTSSYIRKANKARAFLSYQELVRSYLAPKGELPNPNLYELIIETLLGNHTLIGPNITNRTIAERWAELKVGLDKNSARYAAFKVAKDSLPGFEQDLLQLLRPILTETNNYLTNYFKNDLLVDINNLLVRLHKNLDAKGWRIDRVFRLDVNLFNDSVNNGYQHTLNEARLSSIAICLYLAAIKNSPQPDDYKIIFLDDVFIGLDTSNRIPLLELIKAEFSEHQIFISTYDRFWYETAIRWFNVHMHEKWKYYEVFVHHAEHTPGKTFDKPILTNYQSNLAKGLAALKNDVKPDYPSAANNFRKYAEELLTNKYLIPEAEIRNQFATDQDYYGELTRGYKLTQIVDNAIRFINSIHQDTTLLLELKGHLSTLLHPLSHFELASPVYKGELIRIEKCLLNLTPFLENIKSNYKIVSFPLKKMRLNFVVSDTVIRRYFIVKIPQLYVINDGAGNFQFSICECYTPKVSSETVGHPILNTSCDYKNNSAAFKFISLLDCCTKLRNADISIAAYSTIPPIVDYIDNFEYEDAANTWQPLRSLLVW